MVLDQAMKTGTYKHSEETRLKMRLVHLGTRLSDEHKQKISESLKGDKNPFWGKHHSTETLEKVRESNSSNWVGDNVGYGALHDWVRKYKGTPSLCEHCGTSHAKKFEWANKSHEYLRDLDDWIRLCTKCHRKYDRSL